jgi:uncharacterized protein
MRLLCDEMLGRLARWLRLLGLDVAYVQHVDDAELLRLADAEDRLLLTRDEALATRAGPERALRVRTLEPDAQLREVALALGLRPDPGLLLSRCSLCNTSLAPVTRAQAEGSVPPAVLASHDQFWTCPGCLKFYWRGTHTARIEEVLRGLPERGA